MSVSEIRTILFDIAPEFYSIDSNRIAVIDRIIGYSLDQMNTKVWRNKLNLGCGYLTAHKLKLAQISENANSNGSAITSWIVTKEKLGDQELTYADNSKFFDKGYYSTIYGQEYERLKASLARLPFALGS